MENDISASLTLYNAFLEDKWGQVWPIKTTEGITRNHRNYWHWNIARTLNATVSYSCEKETRLFNSQGLSFIHLKAGSFTATLHLWLMGQSTVYWNISYSAFIFPVILSKAFQALFHFTKNSVKDFLAECFPSLAQGLHTTGLPSWQLLAYRCISSSFISEEDQIIHSADKALWAGLVSQYLPLHSAPLSLKVFCYTDFIVQAATYRNMDSPKEERYSRKISSVTSVFPRSTTESGGPRSVPPCKD